VSTILLHCGPTIATSLRAGGTRHRATLLGALAFSSRFTPVLAKHSKSLNLLDSISVGVDRMQRNFGPMQQQVEAWQGTELSNVAAKMIVYEAFIESELDVPKHLARRVHDFYFLQKTPAEEFTCKYRETSVRSEWRHSIEKMFWAFLPGCWVAGRVLQNASIASSIISFDVSRFA
jgi:hypothetical protein